MRVYFARMGARKKDSARARRSSSGSAWKEAIRSAVDSHRAEHFGHRLIEHGLGGFFESMTGEQAHVLAHLFSGSRAMSDLLLAKPELIGTLEPGALKFPRQAQGLRREVMAWSESLFKNKEYSALLACLREFKQKEMLRITARDLARLGNVMDLTLEISNLADLCLDIVYRVSLQQLVEKFGMPYTRETTGEWQPATFSVLGMGKLGAQELNYSSDIDVLFVYSAEGQVFRGFPEKSGTQRTLTNHQFYLRLSEAIISEISRMTAEGALFRIDLRLRPEGKAGPLARSLASYESYYAQWGQTWERMMLIKARPVAGDKALGAEFLEMVQPFRFPRSISEEIPREVGAMKQRTENEIVRSGELERNVKLGRGGIREIEFVSQTFQVLHAGRIPFLQTSQTLPALEKLSDYHLLEASDAQKLRRAYIFLRDLEHRIQMEDNRQTHTIPAAKPSRERLARLMGFSNLAEFESALDTHRASVRGIYEKIIRIEPVSADESLPPAVTDLEEEWKTILAQHSFRDPEKGVRLIKEFVHGPGFSHVSGRTTESAIQLIGRILKLCDKRGAPPPGQPMLSDPDRVLARLDSYVAAYGARAMLYEAWAGNPSLFKLLLLVFDRSEYLAELAIRVPDLIDEIEQSGQLRRKRNSDQVLDDLRHGIAESDQHLWLRRYFQAEQMRIGTRDILDLAPPEQTQAELTALADAFLIYGLEAVMKKNKLKTPPFAIFGLGKLGGSELIYASDLDILFIAKEKSANLPSLQKYALDVMDLLSRRTENGATFATDARLRPDGEKGLIVNTLGGYEDYYKKRAMLWEIQSLSRLRPITGDAGVLKKFAELAGRLTDFSKPSRLVHAYSADWKEKIDHMRMRIEKERTPAGKNGLAVKTGSGGLMDAEFLAQALCLEHGWHEPNTLRALARARDEKKMPAKNAETAMEQYRRLMSIERILRRWSFEPESVLPEDSPALYRVAVRCGFETPEAFLKAVEKYRAELRQVYADYFRCFSKKSSGKGTP
jgi:glutamate-ammonia-ligase adenylyltransferase